MNNYSAKFEKMRIAGKLASQTLDMLTEHVKSGVSTDKIDQLGYEFINDNGGHLRLFTIEDLKNLYVHH